MAKQPGYALYPGSGAADELIYANALLPLSELPGQFADTMYKQRLMALKEAEYLEERRKTKRDEFLRSSRALAPTAGGAAPGAARAAGGGGGGGAGAGTAPGAPLEAIAGPGGELVVPGYGGSAAAWRARRPEDISASDVMEDLETLRRRHEERLTAAETLSDYDRLMALSRGAAPTAEERAQELISEYGLAPARAARVARREAAGRETPFLEGLVEERGARPPATSEVTIDRETGLPFTERDIPAGVTWTDVAEGDDARGEGRPGRPDWVGKTFRGPWPSQPLETEPIPGGDMPTILERALDAPKDPLRGRDISYLDLLALEYSEVMSGVLDGDYLGGETAERVMEARAYEKYLLQTGDEEAAHLVKEVRTAAFAQRAREEEEFVRGLVPGLRKAKVGDPEGLARLWWNNPDEAKTVYGGAVNILKSQISASPRHRVITERLNAARELGEATTAAIRREAIGDYDTAIGLLIDDTDSDLDAGGKVSSDYEKSYRDLEAKATGGPKGETKKQRVGQVGEMVDRWAADPEGYGLSPADVRALLEQRAEVTAAERSMNGLEDDRARLLAEREALQAAAEGKGMIPDTVEVNGRTVPTTWNKENPGGLSNPERGTQARGAADLFLERDATARTRGDLKKNKAYLGIGETRPTRARRGADYPTPTPDMVDRLAGLYVAKNVYSREEAEITAATLAVRNPDKFNKDLQMYSRKGRGGRVRPLIDQESWEAAAQRDDWRPPVDPESSDLWTDEDGRVASAADLEEHYKKRVGR